MKSDHEKLPLALFELSVMRETVRGFRNRISEDDATRLLSRLALLESKARQLIEISSHHRGVEH
ncbi:MAG: hypothetical protein ACRD2I_10570 [Vicinamibacterales bacterium]